MPTYKDIWYADSTTPLNASAISAAEATSIGNKFEEVYYQLPIKVQNIIERDEIFPEPKQGDAVYRLDIGQEERYFETYSIKDNISGKPNSGWYLVNSGQNFGTSIISQEVGSIGGGGVTSAPLGNIFTGDFTFYQIDYHFFQPGTAADIRLQLRTGTSPVTASEYKTTQIGNNAAAPVSRTGTLSYWTLNYAAFTAQPVHSGNITLCHTKLSGHYAKLTGQTYNSGFTGTQSTAMISGYFNADAQACDGFRFFSTQPFIGTFSVRGYN